MSTDVMHTYAYTEFRLNSFTMNGDIALREKIFVISM